MTQNKTVFIETIKEENYYRASINKYEIVLYVDDFKLYFLPESVNFYKDGKLSAIAPVALTGIKIESGLV